MSVFGYNNYTHLTKALARTDDVPCKVVCRCQRDCTAIVVRVKRYQPFRFHISLSVSSCAEVLCCRFRWLSFRTLPAYLAEAKQHCNHRRQEFYVSYVIYTLPHVKPDTALKRDPCIYQSRQPLATRWSIRFLHKATSTVDCLPKSSLLPQREGRHLAARIPNVWNQRNTEREDDPKRLSARYSSFHHQGCFLCSVF